VFEPKNKKENVDFLNEYAGQGFENISQEDLKMPFLRILQKGSPQVDPNDTNYIQGAKPGMFYNTVTQKLYSDKIQVVPVRYEKVWLEWKPDRGGLVGRHVPHSIEVDKTDFSKWKYKGNIIQESLLFYLLVVSHFEDGPMVFALQSTGIKHGKNWNTQIIHTRLPNGKQAPYFSSVWELSSIACSNAKGTWFQIGDTTTSIKRVRFINIEDLKHFVNPAKEALGKSEVDFKQLEDNTVPANDNVPF
jgi:hypothetical protein